MTTEVPMGIWRHYKGPLYLVLGLGHDANAGELFPGKTSTRRVQGEADIEFADVRLSPLGNRTVVVYVPLQLDPAHLGPRLAVRSLDDFTAIVCATSGCEEYGKKIASPEGLKVMDPLPDHPMPGHIGLARFTYLGPELTAEMIPND